MTRLNVSPINALIILVLAFSGLAIFIATLGTIEGTLDPTAAFAACGAVISTLVGVIAIRINADSKANRNNGKEDKDK